ncbi:FAD-dependent oxidoreductase [Halobacterium zhouii]|uniref:FAD-dependent oxidoreductase n=1 Tax=Halobacterium zhouii TaxID=2902624 RepID=UPI001E29A998|nr:FAD-dependent oxidoreductase [Halobacterium zhouii]
MTAHGPDDGTTGEQTSVWLDTTPETDYGSLSQDVTVDTAVVGGGIVGVTTAFELAEAGQSVALVERDHVLTGVTGHTTAKLTAQHGLVYRYLLDEFGRRRARQYATANQTAIDDVEARVEDLGIDCDFERTAAYTYTESADDREQYRSEADAASALGLPASYTESLPEELDAAGAVQFDDQARFHPRKYLLALADEVDDGDSHVFERTTAVDVEDGDPCRVTTDRGTVMADDVVLATHFPIHDRALYFARMHPKRSYVLAVELENDPPDGLYYRPGDPYFSVRPVSTAERTVLVGGQNHRTGTGGSTEARYRRLERSARDAFDVASIRYRWSTQDQVSVDRVPFVGLHAPFADHVYVATGFGGWGMTNGTAAGRVLSDLVLEGESPWQEVYRPTRFEATASTRALLSHGAATAKHLVGDRFEHQSKEDVRALGRGDAGMFEVEGDRVAVYRDDDGEVHAVSAVCTHMGCLVHWNDAHRTWDCPCHGSRFDHDGSVIDTPAVDGLEEYDGALSALESTDRT